MINLDNISSHVGSRMQANYGYLFHPLAATGRDVRQTNALTHIDPEANKHQEHEAHGEKGQEITPDHVRSFTEAARSTRSFFGGPGGPTTEHEPAPSSPKNPTAPK